MSAAPATPATGPQPPELTRPWLPESVAACAVLVLGLAEAGWRSYGILSVHLPITVLGLAVAVLFLRQLPGASLALLWLIGGAQVVTGTSVLTLEILVLGLVSFGCARWGAVPTVVLSGLSIPVSGGLAGLLVISGRGGIFWDNTFLSDLLDNAYRFSGSVLVAMAAVLVLLVLALPWLAGLLTRSVQRTRRSEVSQQAAEEGAARAQRDAYQAQEIAQLREEQARLARDVHDVVGHSLAVILAQAESAQYLPDDPARLKETMTTIAASARQSLQDVRQVLSATSRTPPRPGGLEELVHGVRASGQEVLVEEIGAPQPLPPELEVVAHRVLQEMLTNAVKHGRRDRPIRLERHWPANPHEHDLRIEVTNAVPDVADTVPIGAPPPGASGQGVDGMRRRLDSVGGKLDVRTRDGAFVATAWVPVRAR